MPMAPTFPSPEQAALYRYLMSMVQAEIDPDRAPTPEAYLTARTLKDLAALLGPQAARQVAETPPSVARDTLVALAYAAVGDLGITLATPDGAPVARPDRSPASILTMLAGA